MRYASAVILAGLCATPAQAAPAQAVFDRINQYLAPLGGEVMATLPGKSKSAMISAKDIVLQAELGPPIPLASLLVMTPPRELADGALLVEQAGMMAFDREANGLRIAFSSLNMQNTLLPSPGETNPLIWAQAPGSFELENLVVSFGRQALEVDYAALVILPRPEIGTPDPTEILFTLKLDGVLVNQSVLELIPPDFPGFDASLEGSKANFYVGGRWDLTDGTLSIEPMRIDAATRGSWIATAQFGGVSLPLLNDVVAYMSEKAGSQGNGTPAEAEAFGLRLLSQLTLIDATMLLDDKGIVEAALAKAADDMGVSATEARAQAVEEARNGLAAMGLPQDFADASAAALEGFAGNAISLVAKPTTPVSFIEVVALAASPAALVQRLGLAPGNN